MNVPLSSVVRAWAGDLTKKSFADSIAELASVAASMQSDEQVRGALMSPLISSEKKDSLLKKAGISESTRALLGFVDDQSLWRKLPEVIRTAERLHAELHETKQVTVRSAVKLSSTQRTSLEKALTKKLSADVAIHETVEPALVGGLVVEANGQRFDHSVRGKLNRLARAVTSFTHYQTTQ